MRLHLIWSWMRLRNWRRYQIQSRGRNNHNQQRTSPIKLRVCWIMGCCIRRAVIYSIGYCLGRLCPIMRIIGTSGKVIKTSHLLIHCISNMNTLGIRSMIWWKWLILIRCCFTSHWMRINMRRRRSNSLERKLN